MSPKFAQHRPPSIILPVLLALFILGAIIFVVIHYTPDRTADLTISHTALYQAHTVFHSDTILTRKDNAQDDLYVLTTLHIDDRLNLPLFIKNLTATLTLAGGQTFTANATEKTDLAPLLSTFPALKPLASAPLFRETLILPGKFAEGMVLLQFPITRDLWDHRQSAILTVDFYHQDPQTILIPNP